MLQGRVTLDFSCSSVSHKPLRWLLGSPAVSKCEAGVKGSHAASRGSCRQRDQPFSKIRAGTGLYPQGHHAAQSAPVQEHNPVPGSWPPSEQT